MDRIKLQQLEIHGFKSICPDDRNEIKFGDITILLGANGAGKSNLISFFSMLNYLTTNALQTYIGKQGGADALLYYGAKVTDKIEFSLTFSQENEGHRSTKYVVKLVHGMPDRLFFAGEKVVYQRECFGNPKEIFVDSGNGESGLPASEDTTCKILYETLARIKTYHFHDTSDTAKIKANCYVGDAKYLKNDAGNLAAYLRVMKNGENKRYYDRIVRHIQKIMPQFGDFELEPLSVNDKTVRLDWVEKESGYIFGPHQISDGSLRFMALSTLLLQPNLPNVIVMDEPELGLHPAAVVELAGMIRTASKDAQIIISTQSTRLVDEFDAEHVIVVERDENKRCSRFRRLNEKALGDWLAQYSLSELWEKNVFGGRP